jgi:hypothetical protein
MSTFLLVIGLPEWVKAADIIKKLLPSGGQRGEAS